MYKMLTSALLAAVISLPTMADDKAKTSPEKEKMAKELTSMVGINGQIGNMFNSIYTSLEQQLTNDNSNSVGDIKKVKEIFETVVKKFEPKIVEVTAKSTAENFSDAELKDIIAFYKTPAGEKVIKTMPVVMQQSMQGSMAVAQDMLNEVDKEIKAQLPELSKKLEKQAKEMQAAQAAAEAKAPAKKK